ncbi:D-glycerate dehydrogenase [Paenibacillus sp. CECT 9249]|uniref:2-hydroxyacid dehydrogenase n=1 Tax=unclassified Paenibacillus TaxID=185978 RepID=UPI001E4E5F9C|nr:D-glycerate dehydrogenase [Paenibacillus sp. CECT 9249]CAH0121617.1 Glyoxylate/hydroxypyruvate reductase B [Paenibacillus sp. CECT 9249]
MKRKPQVLVISKLEPPVYQSIAEVCDIVSLRRAAPDFGQQLAACLPQIEGIIGSGFPVDAALLREAPNLRVVSNISVGYENLNIVDMTAHGVMATNTPDVLTETTADLIFGLMLAAARRIPELDRYVKEGNWNKSIGKERFGLDVYGKTLGIIGMGRIGAAVARRAKLGFRMPVLYYNRSRNEAVEAEIGAVYTSMPELLGQSDFVCLMAPYSPEAGVLIGEKEFDLMKKTAVFVNGSRGKNVDEHALVRALESGRIAAAGLDVYEKEPLGPPHPLLEMDHAVTLPHIGSATYDTRLEMQKLAAQNLLCGIQGTKPPSLINEDVWLKRAQMGNL